MNEGGSF